MARKEIYLNDEELAYVNEQPDGWVRTIIQAKMLDDGKKIELPEGMGIAVIETPAERSVLKEANAKRAKIGIEPIPEPKSVQREPGFCEKGHWVGVGFKKCKLCGGKVR